MGVSGRRAGAFKSTSELGQTESSVRFPHGFRHCLLACCGLMVVLACVIVQYPVAAASPISSDTFWSVSCISSTFCVAAGTAVTATFDTPNTLIETWDGNNWTVIPSPNPSHDNILFGISCTSTTSCMAVGWDDSGPGEVSSNLAELWNGTSWSIVPTPNAGQCCNNSNYLLHVSCTSSSNCVAVGYYYNNGTAEQLIESWDGTTWSIAYSQTDGSGTNLLSDVSCTGADFCVAVGELDYGTGIESWNGTAWSPATIPAGSDAYLNGVSCVSTTDCQAVGFGGLIDSWNGTSWTVSPSPTPGAGTYALSDVSCVDSTDCAAVGSEQPQVNSGAYVNLIESFDGNEWSIVSSPDPSQSYDSLAGVSCTGPGSCMAVGGYESAYGSETLAESWNGTTWSLSPSTDEGVFISPASGVPRTSVVVSGGGLNPGEQVKATYNTDSTSRVILCTTVANSDGTFSCSGAIPRGQQAGDRGAHKIIVKGLTSGITFSTRFKLTRSG